MAIELNDIQFKISYEVEDQVWDILRDNTDPTVMDTISDGTIDSNFFDEMSNILYDEIEET